MSSYLERLRGRLPTRDTRPPDDGRRRAAVAALVHDHESGPRVLLMKRSERSGDPWSGHISLPGGGFQSDDLDLRATAIRETHEELGIQLGDVAYAGPLPVLSPLSSGPLGIEVTPFVFVTETSIAPQLGPEAFAAFWLPLTRAAAGELDDTYTYPGTERTFPSWRYEGHTIWGLTWRILGDLLVAAK